MVRASRRRPLDLPDAGATQPPAAEDSDVTPAEEAPVDAAPSADPPRGGALPEGVSEQAREILDRIVALMGVEATVNVGASGELVLSGDKGGLLIGRRGQTLDALEYVLNRIIARESAGARISIDAENYRARRRESLEELAARMADRVRKRGKPVSLNPMSPRDRRIVHLALQDDASLVTRSTGEGQFRRLIISPAGNRGGGRSRSRRRGSASRRGEAS